LININIFCFNHRWPDVWILKLSQGRDWVGIRDLHAAELVSLPFFNTSSIHTTTTNEVLRNYHLRSEDIPFTKGSSLVGDDIEIEETDGKWRVELAIGFTALTPKPQLFSGQLELLFINTGISTSNSSQDSDITMIPRYPPSQPNPPTSIPPEQHQDMDILHEPPPPPPAAASGRRIAYHYYLDQFTTTTTIGWNFCVLFLCIWIVYLCSRLTYHHHHHYCLRYQTIPDVDEDHRPTSNRFVHPPTTSYQSSITMM
jgi:hypothetical protein